MYRFRQFFLSLLAVLAFSGCYQTKVRLDQPVTVGIPGKVYQATTAEVSVDVVNNSGMMGDILVGETFIDSLGAGDVRNVGFYCNGMVVWLQQNRRFQHRGSYNVFVRFKPRDNTYETLSRSVSVNCGTRRTMEFNVRFLRPIRTQR
ncbi:MAG: hypothetical protein A2741_00925 [Candidatus Zambryskibacteria bacterium RIFCSPHIGHO2_01_FULL_43_27]|uniref:Lipoprotein n=1 Tax=Candidatus Zambryskibacteria bacterium RIFCSPLOWO2_01_FULL_43_17 TaxID=1802760 RepID=A0A1G2U533_9BACT|nr:MAG: hypothetical protein A2741_00925 [Candidatus Zambryskibacteria bacterium RIFCSPHIGHO2_01_FULL_43_27]OHB00067.1 MAG: hypothetical protein A3E93_01920 [Candidatus Zambryskibacteria bacterium RIFCSPHIGHO2_12_FULL_43_12b]OHB04598.1 MAG: hypothetical protein A2920_01505 [Candidatus Zambryskibacteria bacterium RIFCSPLOWO2_01_FULL_43_17]